MTHRPALDIDAKRVEIGASAYRFGQEWFWMGHEYEPWRAGIPALWRPEFRRGYFQARAASTRRKRRVVAVSHRT